MGLPTVDDNLRGYEQGQLLNNVDNIKTKMYYLIHGTLDDNVHYQQSLLLAKVLEQKDILFRQQVRQTSYSDERTSQLIWVTRSIVLRTLFHCPVGPTVQLFQCFVLFLPRRFKKPANAFRFITNYAHSSCTTIFDVGD